MEELIFATLTKREEDDKEDLSYLFHDTSYYGTWEADDDDEDDMVSRKKKKKTKLKQLSEEDIEMLCKYTSEEGEYYENN